MSEENITNIRCSTLRDRNWRFVDEQLSEQERSLDASLEKEFGVGVTQGKWRCTEARSPSVRTPLSPATSTVARRQGYERGTASSCAPSYVQRRVLPVWAGK